MWQAVTLYHLNHHNFDLQFIALSKALLLLIPTYYACLLSYTRPWFTVDTSLIQKNPTRKKLRRKQGQIARMVCILNSYLFSFFGHPYAKSTVATGPIYTVIEPSTPYHIHITHAAGLGPCRACLPGCHVGFSMPSVPPPFYVPSLLPSDEPSWYARTWLALCVCFQMGPAGMQQ